MAKKVLLVESDTAHARELYKALEACGVEVRVTGDGKEGLELARDERPDAIVLCVELPRVSGYSICQKLKKDPELQDIPVVLTSSEATLDTFEQHRKLKGRAEEYLIKPFPPQALVGKLAPFLGIDPGASQDYPSDEEMVTLADVELEATGSHSLGGGANPLAGGDDEIKFLDDAFERLSSTPEAAPAEEEIELGLDPAPPADDARLDAAFGEFEAAPHPAPAAGEAGAPLEWSEPSQAGNEAELESSRAKQERLAAELASSRAEQKRLAAELQASRAEQKRLTADLESSHAEQERLTGELESSQAEQERLAAELQSSRAEHERATGELESSQSEQERLAAELETSEAARQDAEARLAHSEGQVAAHGERVAQLTGKLGELERASGARRDLEQRLAASAEQAAALTAQLSDLQARSGRNEERLLRAVARLKQDAAARARALKALAIAQQLLGSEGAQAQTDGTPPAEEPTA